MQEVERVFRGAERGRRCIVGARKKGAANPRGKVDRCKEVEGGAIWLGVEMVSLRGKLCGMTRQ